MCLRRTDLAAELVNLSQESFDLSSALEISIGLSKLAHLNRQHWLAEEPDGLNGARAFDVRVVHVTLDYGGEGLLDGVHRARSHF